MYQISKVYTFEAAHFLPNVPEGHKCGKLHGHSYTVEINLQSKSINHTAGWFLDFGDVKAMCDPYFKSLDHSLLNDYIPNPTSENLAKTIFDFFAPVFSQYLYSVSVSETATSKVTYWRES